MEHCGARTRSGTPCKKQAGWGTDHLGQGKCRLHGGATPTKHGRYSKITRPRVRELLEHYRNDPDPLNLHEELSLLRALLTDYIERYDDMTDGIHRWHASFQNDYLEARQRWLQEVQTATAPEIESINRATLGSIELIVDHVGQDATLDRVLERVRASLERAVSTARKTLATIPPAPDPLEFVHKPKRLLDITAAAGLIDQAGKMVDRIEKQKQNGIISLATLEVILNQVGIELTNAAREVLGDEAVRTTLLETFERRWNDIALRDRASSDPERPQGLQA